MGTRTGEGALTDATVVKSESPAVQEVRDITVSRAYAFERIPLLIFVDNLKLGMQQDILFP